MESMMIWMPIAMALLGLAYMLFKKSWVMKQDAGDGKMKEISDHIYEGALAFLKAEYRLLAIFVIVVSVLLAIVSFVVPTTHWLIVIAFIFGAVFAALTTFLQNGMFHFFKKRKLMIKCDSDNKCTTLKLQNIA